MRYRKKPVEVDAIQWTGDNTDDVKAFIGERQRHGGDEPRSADNGECGFLLAAEVFGVINGDAIVFDRFHDWVPLHVGDWVIRGVRGEYYPCEPAVFEQTYDPVVHIGDQVYAVEDDGGLRLVGVDDTDERIHT